MTPCLFLRTLCYMSLPINQAGWSWTSDLQVVKYDYSDQKRSASKWNMRTASSFIPSHLSASVCKALLYRKALKVVRDISAWVFSLNEIVPSRRNVFDQIWEEHSSRLFNLWMANCWLTFKPVLTKCLLLSTHWAFNRFNSIFKFVHYIYIIESSYNRKKV